MRAWHRLGNSLRSGLPCARAVVAAALPPRHLRLSVRMVEGHQCHRVAHVHRQKLLNRRFDASSPNGRFTEGAKAIHQQPLHRIEVHGKNLFYFFGRGDAQVVLHIHFGMSGNFFTAARGAELPLNRDTTRLLLVDKDTVSQLSAMTVAHGFAGFYEEKIAKLGPDPLRDDADGEIYWAKIQKSKKPVGLTLMDQSMVAGLGNIYRAEVLYKARIHPEQPANTVDRAGFEALWRHSVELLQRGFKTGSILTVDPADAKALGPPWTRRYIYNQARCGRCKGVVQTWDMAARTVYCCPACQPLPSDAALAEARAKAVAAAKPTRTFLSHCAPDGPATAQSDPHKLTVAELKVELRLKKLPLSGKKGELVERLAAALAESTAGEAQAAAQAAADATGQPALATVTEVAVASRAADIVDEEVALEGVGDPMQLLAGPLGGAGDPLAGVEDPMRDTTGDPALEVSAAKAALRRQQQQQGAVRVGTAHLGAPQGRTRMTDGRRPPAAAAAAAAEESEEEDEEEGGERLAGAASAPQKGERRAPAKKGPRRGKAAAKAAEEEAGPSGRGEGPAGAGIKTGTAHLGRIATAEEAAAEKLGAAEGRNVEHVALQTEGTLGLAHTGPTRGRRKGKAAEVAGEEAGEVEEGEGPSKAGRKRAAGTLQGLRKRKAGVARTG